MSLGCLCCNIMPFNAPKTLDNYMYICSINLVEHRFFEPSWEKQIGANYREVWKIEGKHTVFDWWRKVEFGSNYRNQGFKIGEGVSVQRLSIITDLYWLSVNLPSKESFWRKYCFLLFYCNTEPLQGFLRRFSEVQTIALDERLVVHS